MTDKLIIEVSRDGWTKGLQLGISQVDEDGGGHGWRLAGPKYNGSSKTLLKAELEQRDADEIRKYLDAVFPLKDATSADLEQENARLTAELAKYVGKEPTVAEEMQYLGSCLDAVHEVCDAAEKGAARWETPLPVPEWVAPVREAAEGQRPNDPADNRRRIYIDGKGNAWLSVATDVDGTEYIAPIDSPHNGDQPTGTVRETTGGLREIGRTP